MNLRYTDRALAYSRYRPAYPEDVMAVLMGEIQSQALDVVADLGAGTGIFTRILLEHGFHVYAVEPDQAMRAECERLLSHCPKYVSVNGTAEHTGLAASSVDIVSMAQSFHWFHPIKASQEVVRILRPGGIVMVLWNERLRSGARLLEELERLLRLEVHAYEGAVMAIDRQFEDGLAILLSNLACTRRFSFSNPQILAEEAFTGRFFSSSFAPNRTSEDGHALEAALRSLHRRYAVGGTVTIEQNTTLITGRLSVKS